MVISTVRKEGKRHTAGPQCRGNSGSQAALFRGSAHLRIHEQGNERKALVVRRRSILDQRPCRTSLRIAGHGRGGKVRDTLPATTPGEFSGQISLHQRLCRIGLRIDEHGVERNGMFLRQPDFNQRPCRESLRIDGHGIRGEAEVDITLPDQTPGTFSN